ncbi:hypothetical protein N657DRAFT_641914 [Parathielavia appendiculata]|uniref:Uncharacterized protein n=1 Tax=Parathielavia appendiculata TaxID=2587402 RepID=A0AAN6U7H6_9PEZI|nr:hypothetical protein N657DRAFT_641914 [Parathielavia appendiculata]
MDQPTSQAGIDSDATSASSRPPAPARKRSTSGAGGLLSKLPFIRFSGEHRPRSRRNTNESELAGQAPTLPVPSFTTISADAPQRQFPASAAAAQPPPPHIVQHQALQPTQQQKTRRRRGSLRKVALLGRGAQRERREGRGLTIDTKLEVTELQGALKGTIAAETEIASSPVSLDGHNKAFPVLGNGKGDFPRYGLGIPDRTPRPSIDRCTIRSDTSDPDATPTTALTPRAMTSATSPPTPAVDTSPSRSYSTTDDEDALHMARPATASLPIPRTTTASLSSSSAASLLRPERASLSSGSESYFLASRQPSTGTSVSGGALPSIQRRRNTIQRAKSPLALTSLATPLPQPDADWDYAETEWWGWIILLVTWTVFVVGMGSCLGVWSWAWDVGKTPYAPPELEDDPTLPIVGYYPALMILTGVMAWVWVVVAWVGMKYFRHAQVSGD